MKFKRFFISPTILSKKEEIIKNIKVFDCFESPEPGESIIEIGSIDEVIKAFGSKKYIISDVCLKEMVTLHVPEFPLKDENRQRISICFGPLWVSSVGFHNVNDVVEINKKVLLLGGIFSRGFDENVSILISKTNLSYKTIQARKHKVPVVTIDWLEFCFKNLQRAPLNNYLLKPFFGLTFTSSDLSPNEHHDLKRLVISNGGKWSDVCNDNVTYLISSGLTNTKKIEICLSLGIPIVKPDYIRDPSKFEVLNWWSISNEHSDLFKGLIFSIHKQTKNIEALQEAIRAHSGSFGNKPTHAIVPHGYKANIKSNIQIIEYITEAWIWGCIEKRKILPLSNSPLFTPLPYGGPFNDIANMVFYLSNSLDDKTRRFTATLIREAGGNPIFKPTKDVKIAVSNDYDDELFNLGIKGKIKIVTPKYILAIFKQGKLPDPEEYQVKTCLSSDMISNICAYLQTKIPKKISKEEKIKIEKLELDQFTQDLTQNSSSISLEITYASQSSSQRQSKNIGLQEGYDPLLDAFQH